MSTLRFRYTVLLLSDTCCGSGTGNGSDVDVRASFDAYGLPMIPAKRLRGLLRENALLLEGKYGHEAIISLFGESGRRSRLQMDDARLFTGGEDAETVGRVLRQEGVSPRAVSAVFTRKRTQTAIDEKGIADEHTLRTLETVRRGTEFAGELRVSDPAEHDGEILKNAFKLLTAIGLDKKRGLGWVKCTVDPLSDPSGRTVSGEYRSTGERREQPYTLYLAQDVTLLLNSVMQNPDFIPGSVMQGAFATLFSDKPYFEAMFFEDLKFGNAYASDGKRTFVPAPLSLVSVKNEEAVFDLADGYRREADKQYVSAGGYLCRENRTLYSASADSAADYHINLGQSDKPGKTFYNVIKLCRGQYFRGSVSGSPAALALLESAFRTTEGVLYIGSSVSAQYGKCIAAFPEKAGPEERPRFRKGDTVAALLVSDAILPDEFGTNTLDCAALFSEIAGTDAELCRDADGRELMFVKNGTAGGWNTKWGMPKMQYRTFSRGSTFVFTCKADTSALPAWIGIGNAEGYGQVWYRKTVSPERLTICRAETEKGNPVSSAEAQRILTAVKDAEQKENLIITALRDACSAEQKFGRLSNSAAMRIMNLLRAETEDGSALTSERFWDGKKKFDHNIELTELADCICDGYGRWKKDAGRTEEGDTFTLYLRTFLGRFKELHKGAKDRGEGEGEQS